MSNLNDWARFWVKNHLEREGFDPWAERDTSQDEAMIRERLEWIGENPNPKQFSTMLAAWRSEAQRIYRRAQEKHERDAEDVAGSEENLES
jgi:hypothetical protein